MYQTGVNLMLQFIKTKKTYLLAIVLGIVSFAAYGIYNIVHAMAASGASVTSGDAPAAINTLAPAGDKLDGAVCSPFGCAGCSGCSNPLYQTAADDVYQVSLNE
jgi:zona occludens toxin (predicted ATPase)